MNSEENPVLLRQRAGGVVTLTLNRPQRRHALSLGLLSELDRALSDLAEDRTARAVVLASSGKVFCSGHDLGEMRDRTAEEYEQLFALCSRVMQRIRQLPQPVIARIQGLATAAGCQLVAACDLAVASETATFATPGVKIGLFCTTPMVPLVRSVPAKVAMEMLLTGTPITAQRALQVGLVNAVAAEDQLDEIISQWTSAIVTSSAGVIALGKREFYAQLPLSEPAAYDRAVHVMTDNAVQADAQEGMSAFLEKRPPRWSE